MVKKSTAEEFIEKAKKIHGDTYDYSQVEYKGCTTRLKIVCKTHGIFEQTPRCHLIGKGCHKCGVSGYTNEEFIEKAVEIHGDKYDYSKVEYKGYRTKLRIICKIHGEFKQMAVVHLMGRGCRRCGATKYTTDSFTEKAVEIHGDKYDYNKVEYIGSLIKVKIICKSCINTFEQTPNDHLQSHGCSYCSGNKKCTTDEFIEKAVKIHGDKYDYSKVVYVTNKNKVKITCKNCECLFEQKPDAHIQGSGCLNCSGKMKHTLETFIQTAKTVHNNKYDYKSVTEYVNNQTKVKILCREHGEFEQSPHSHLMGSGCITCSGRFKSSNEEFIKRANLVHGDKYDYESVEYINNSTKVKILCKTHGIFEQAPVTHINSGCGCPKCHNYATEKKCRDTIENMFETIFDYKYINYLPDKRFQLDGYNEPLGIAFEYNGEQHYYYIPFFL